MKSVVLTPNLLLPLCRAASEVKSFRHSGGLVGRNRFAVLAPVASVELTQQTKAIHHRGRRGKTINLVKTRSKRFLTLNIVAVLCVELPLCTLWLDAFVFRRQWLV